MSGAQQALMSYGAPLLSSLLLPMDTNLLDVYGNTITNTGGVTLLGAGNGPFAGTGAALFNGGRLSLPTSSAFNVGSSPWTWETWIYLIGAGGAYGIVFCLRDGDVATGLGVKMNNASATQIGFESADSALASINSTYPFATLTASTWTHIAVSYDGSYLRAFAGGGVSSNLPVGAKTFYYNSADTIVIGNQTTPSRAINARLSNLRFTKGVARYTGTFTPPTAPFTS